MIRAPTPATGPRSPPTARTASGWRVIGTGLKGTGDGDLRRQGNEKGAEPGCDRAAEDRRL